MPDDPDRFGVTTLQQRPVHGGDILAGGREAVFIRLAVVNAHDLDAHHHAQRNRLDETARLGSADERSAVEVDQHPVSIGFEHTARRPYDLDPHSPEHGLLDIDCVGPAREPRERLVE